LGTEAARHFTPAEPAGRILPWLAGTGWLAAAAAVVVALTVWLQSPRDAVVVEPAAASASFDEFARRPGVVTTSLAVASDDATLTDAEADVLWDAETGKGWLRLEHLPSNNAAESQYQLWVIDASRPDDAGRNRVDAGVFDVESGVTTVRFEPKLPVGEAIAFAVTREPPGGSVVSALGDRLLLISQ
jgi:anti-sigma-K factor RskA